MVHVKVYADRRGRALQQALDTAIEQNHQFSVIVEEEATLFQLTRRAVLERLVNPAAVTIIIGGLNDLVTWMDISSTSHPGPPVDVFPKSGSKSHMRIIGARALIRCCTLLDQEAPHDTIIYATMVGAQIHNIPPETGYTRMDYQKVLNQSILRMNIRLAYINHMHGVPTPPLHLMAHTRYNGAWRHQYGHLDGHMDPNPLCLIMWAEYLTGVVDEVTHPQ